jgi:hypothetical protein
VGQYPRPLSPRHLAAAKEIDRQQEELLRVTAQEFLRAAGSPHKARRLLADAIRAAETLRKKSKGQPPSPDGFVLQAAAEIKRQNPRFSRRKALLAAMALQPILYPTPEEELRRLEDKLRGRTLAQYVESCPVRIEFVGRIPV